MMNEQKIFWHQDAYQGINKIFIKMVLSFNPHERHHIPAWILLKITFLTKMANYQKDSSCVLYACLEARNLLEMISYKKLQCSVSADEREALEAVAKPKNGITTVDKQLKALGLKTQEFMHALLQSEGAPEYQFPVFVPSVCEAILNKLSQYIHTYTVENKDMEFGSAYIEAGFAVIDEAVEFAESNLVRSPETETCYIINYDIINLPEWAKRVLGDWKVGKIKEVTELIRILEEESRGYASNIPTGV